MDPNAPNLSKAQIERLAFLMEECGELVKAAAKILRHGYVSVGYTNRLDVEQEMGDVVAAITLLQMSNDVDVDRIEKRVKEKMISMRPYMHHQGP
jgi:NTP pyrophosphatase (non-canonical NTP hydrolase)